MPIYEYRCEDCGHQFEYLLIGKEEVTCPKCKSKNLSRLISACKFSFGAESGRSNTSIKANSCSTCSSFS